MDVSSGIVVSANGTITMVEQENCVVSEGGHGSFTDGRDRNSLDGKLAVPMLKTGHLNNKGKIGHDGITFAGAPNENIIKNHLNIAMLNVF